MNENYQHRITENIDQDHRKAGILRWIDVYIRDV